MYASTKLVDKMEGVENLYAWKYRIGLVISSNKLVEILLLR
jgi:hypothetical protein